MGNSVLQKRVLTTAGLLVGALVLLHSISHGERRALRRPLKAFPLALGSWRGRDLPIEQRIVQAAGVDDFLSRVYTDTMGQTVGVYVGYYGTQQTGDSIHSPKNCLPSAGWEPVRAERLSVQVGPASTMVVNEYLVEKGLDRELVLYWYQGRGRVVASEYWGKVWMVIDAVTRHRTDGALVRIVTPAGDEEPKARARAAEFLRLLYPALDEFIPI